MEEVGNNDECDKNLTTHQMWEKREKEKMFSEFGVLCPGGN